MYKKRVLKLINELESLNKRLTTKELEKLLKAELQELSSAIWKIKRHANGCKMIRQKLQEDITFEQADCLILELQLRRRKDYKESKSERVKELLFKFDNNKLARLQLSSVFYKCERTIMRLKGGYYDVR